MSEPLEFKLGDGSSAMFKTCMVNAALCKQLGWALAALGKPAVATQGLLDKLAAAPEGVYEGAASYYDDGGASSESGRLAHNWLLASGRGPYPGAPEALKGAARLRFGASLKGSDHAARLVEAQAKAVALPELDPAEQAWKAYAEGAKLRVELPVARAPNVQKAARVAPEVAANVDERIAWARSVSSLWPAAAAEWKAAGLAFERDPFAGAVRELDNGAWARSACAVEQGALWVAVKDSGAGLAFISPNGSSMVELAGGKTFGSDEDALAWARRHGGIGAIELEWALKGFKGVHPTAPAPASVAQVLTEREKRSIEAAMPAPKAGKGRPGL